MASDPEAPPRRLRRAEAVLARRLANLALIVEDLHDSHNIDAVIRSAEAFGLQRVLRIETDAGAKISRKVTQGAHRWLTVSRFNDPGAALAAARADGFQVWAADVAPGSRPLDELPLPPRLAVAVGSELEGLSEELRASADRRFYLPMSGFTGSLNVSVSAAISVWELSRRFRERDGEQAGLPADERAVLRQRWYQALGKSPAQRARFASWVDRPPPALVEGGPPPERRTLDGSRSPVEPGDD
jgi:tRNA (guanosine-2'-O-)-methyltransferase